jgi:hypothetical protein
MGLKEVDLVKKTKRKKESKILIWQMLMVTGKKENLYKEIYL